MHIFCNNQTLNVYYDVIFTEVNNRKKNYWQCVVLKKKSNSDFEKKIKFRL